MERKLLTETHKEVFDEYDYIALVVGSIDIIVFIVAAIQLYRMHTYEQENTNVNAVLTLKQMSNESTPINSHAKPVKWNGRKLFHEIIMLAMLVEGTYLLIFPVYVHGYIHFLNELQQNIIDNSWKQLGSMFFLLAYFMLLLFWADFYYRANGSRKRVFQKMRGTLLFLLILLPVVVVVACIIQLFSLKKLGGSLLVDDCFGMISSVLSLFIAIGFLYYGIQLNLVLRRFRMLSTRKAAQTRKVVGVAVLASLCFVARSCLYIWSTVTSWENPSTQFSVSWPVMLVFFFCLETVPVSLMLYLLRRIPKQNESTV